MAPTWAGPGLLFLLSLFHLNGPCASKPEKGDDSNMLFEGLLVGAFVEALLLCFHQILYFFVKFV